MELKKYKLGELIDVTRGQSLSGEYYATEGKYIRLTCGNFDYNNNCFKENTSKDNLFFTGTIKPEFIMEKGDIITPLTEQAIGLLGSTAIIPESDKYIQSQDVAKIICKEDKLDHGFAYYLISSKLVKEQLSVAAQQTKIRHTSPDKIKDCTVWIPDMENQRRIAHVLSTLDRKISLNRSINEELERMAKEIYDYWFVQFEFPRSVSGESGLPELSRTDDGNGQSHFPDEHGRPYKSSGGAMVYNPVLKREVPEGWEDCTLGEYAKMYQPKTLSSEDVSLPDGYRVYGANGRIGYYTQYNHKDSEIAMACRGNSCGVLNRTLPFSWITGNAMVIKPHNEGTGNEYLFHAISYMNIEGAITGSGQPQLTRENLSKVKMLLPPILLIDKFNNIISSNLQQRICLEEEKDKLTKLRDELLPLLMTGQVGMI